MKYGVIGLGLVMLWGCLWASFEIPLWVEWPVLKQSPWFLVTLLDLYVGLALFSGFTYFVKRNLLQTLGWTVLFFGLGNMATVVWLLLHWRLIHERFNG